MRMWDMAYVTWWSWPLWVYVTPAAILLLAFEPIAAHFPRLYASFYVKAYIASAIALQIVMLVLAFSYLVTPNKSTTDGVAICSLASQCG